MDNIEVPEYFICPISLQLMKDPVTAISGITYDRESIERWLYRSSNTKCPVTMQPLPRDSDLTPNHTLRRLIQAWCSLHAASGADPVSTPTPTHSKFHIINLMMRDLRAPAQQQKTTLQKLEALAAESDGNRVFMVEAGLAKALTSLIVSCYEQRQRSGIEEALGLFYLLRKSLAKSSSGPLSENNEIMDALMWVLREDGDDVVVRFPAAYAMKLVVKKANPGMLERLKPEFLESILSELRKGSIVCGRGMNCLLHVLLDACPWGRNRVVMVESGAVSDLIEVLQTRSSERRRTEIVLGILYHLCTCADGRAQLVNHGAGIAAVTRPIQEVSSAADERAVLIVGMIAKYCGTGAVVEEMLRVGTVAKLSMVMQAADCGLHVKENAKEILRTHSDVWKLPPYSKIEQAHN